jgi:hypothetical protein
VSFFIDKRLIEATERQAAATEAISDKLGHLVRAAENSVWFLGQLNDRLLKIIYEEEQIEEHLRKVAFSLGRPGQPRVVFTGECKENEMKYITFKAVFAPEMDPTTVQREISVKVGDDLPTVQTVTVDVLDVEGFRAPVDTPIHIEQVDIDDVGNRSPAAVLDTVVADTFPPQQPGIPGVVATGEENVL